MNVKIGKIKKKVSDILDDPNQNLDELIEYLHEIRSHLSTNPSPSASHTIAKHAETFLGDVFSVLLRKKVEELDTQSSFGSSMKRSFRKNILRRTSY